MASRQSKSIHDLPPLETGGVEARLGFAVQDHVAAKYCLELLGSDHLNEVWCESQDDVMLLSNVNGQDKVEFVQVKGNEYDQLWSVSILCKRDKKNGAQLPGSSILEKSLQYDRCSEPCSFRMVTARPVKRELKPLTREIGSSSRESLQSKIDELIVTINKLVGDYKSDNENGPDFWISNVVWEEIHSLDAQEKNNFIVLTQIVESEGETLFIDQIKGLYENILTIVHDAAGVRWKDAPDRKKIKRNAFVDWFEGQLEAIVNPAIPGGGRRVQEKMIHAQIPQDIIDNANDLRRRYRKQRLQPKYMTTRDMGHIESEIKATLHHLRSQLAAGIIKESGVKFHARCLRHLDDLRNRLPSPQPPQSFISGYMYNIVDRCLHRFTKDYT